MLTYKNLKFSMAFLEKGGNLDFKAETFRFHWWPPFLAYYYKAMSLPSTTSFCPVFCSFVSFSLFAKYFVLFSLCSTCCARARSIMPSNCSFQLCYSKCSHFWVSIKISIIFISNYALNTKLKSPPTKMFLSLLFILSDCNVS